MEFVQFSNIDEYINAQEENVRPVLQQLRQTIKKTAPEAKEVISYSMPAFKFYGILVYFGAFKNHYSLFALSNAVHVFKDKLTPYEVSKGTIKFPYDKEFPVDLITDIIKFRVKENLERELSKKTTRNKKMK